MFPQLEPSNWIAIVAIGISLVAITVSGINLYSTWLRRFRPIVFDTGYLELAPNFFESSFLQSILRVNLVFANDGARPGVIYDVCVILMDASGHKTLLLCIGEVSDDMINLKGDKAPPEMRRFSGFRLSGGQSIAIGLLFVQEYEKQVLTFSEQQYIVEIWAMSSRYKRWEMLHTVSFVAPKEAIEAHQRTYEVFPDPPDPSGQRRRGMVFTRFPSKTLEDYLSQLKKKRGVS